MTNREILTCLSALNILYQQDLPTKGGWAVKRNIKIFQDVAEDIEEHRLKLLKEYAAKDDDGNLKEEDGKYVFDSDEVREEFQNKLEEFFDTETDVDVYTVSIDSFVGDGVKIKPVILDAIESIIQ